MPEEIAVLPVGFQASAILGGVVDAAAKHVERPLGDVEGERQLAVRTKRLGFLDALTGEHLQPPEILLPALDGGGAVRRAWLDTGHPGGVSLIHTVGPGHRQRSEGGSWTGINGNRYVEG